jgi:hypothetical protein
MLFVNSICESHPIRISWYAAATSAALLWHDGRSAPAATASLRTGSNAAAAAATGDGNDAATREIMHQVQ